MNAKAIHNEAVSRANRAMTMCNPEPMYVTDGVRNWKVDGGPCGFAWVSGKAKTVVNRAFFNGLKKEGLLSEDRRAPWSKDTYRSGYIMWCSEGGQSMALKETYCHAYTQVLREYGITAQTMSRMD